MNIFTKQKHTHRLREQELMVIRWGKDGGKGQLGECNVHVHTALFKMDSHQAPTVWQGNSVQCYVVTWMGGEFGEGWIHVQVWLSPFAVHLKLS